MELGRCHQGRYQRAAMAWINFYVLPSNYLQDLQRILCDVLKAAVPTNRGDTQQIQMGRGQHDGKRVVMSRVAVQYYFSFIAHDSSLCLSKNVSTSFLYGQDLAPLRSTV